MDVGKEREENGSLSVGSWLVCFSYQLSIASGGLGQHGVADFETLRGGMKILSFPSFVFPFSFFLLSCLILSYQVLMDINCKGMGFDDLLTKLQLGVEQGCVQKQAIANIARCVCTTAGRFDKKK